MIYEWLPVRDFPDYEVSVFGEIIHIDRPNRRLSKSLNQQGIVKVTLRKDGVLFTRSVAVLVGLAFIPEDHDNWPHLNTITHKDGERTNCRVDNLMWRSRHYAINYHKQFNYPFVQLSPIKIIDLETGIVYHGMREAVAGLGVYYTDIMEKCLNGKAIWPYDYNLAHYKE